jgi:hypothetical protein
MNWLEKKILLHYLKEYLGKASNMTLSWNLLFQGAALIVQYGDQATSIIPAKWHLPVSLAVALAQALVAWHAHNVNPDGSPAQVAYIPPKK